MGRFALIVVLALAFTGTASAAQLVDRNAAGLRLVVNTKGEALLTYRSHGVLNNARMPTAGARQVQLRLDYAGG